MTPYIEEALRMLELAEGDFQAFTILRAHPSAPPAPTCFHAQQCVEKALKAVLMAHRVHFHRTHDLEEIVDQLQRTKLLPPFDADEYAALNPCAVDLRYDGLRLPAITAETAGRMAETTLEWARVQIATFR